LALDGAGGAVAYADYAQWEEGRRIEAEKAALRASAARPRLAPSSSPSDRPRRLGYLEQREWDDMEARILEAEARLEACQTAAADPAVVTDHEALAARLEALTEAQVAVERLYARWAELEAKLKV